MSMWPMGLSPMDSFPGRRYVIIVIPRRGEETAKHTASCSQDSTYTDIFLV